MCHEPSHDTSCGTLEKNFISQFVQWCISGKTIRNSTVELVPLRHVIFRFIWWQRVLICSKRRKTAANVTEGRKGAVIYKYDTVLAKKDSKQEKGIRCGCLETMTCTTQP